MIEYVKIGSLDYGDIYGGLVEVFSCQRCGSLVDNQETHTKWHKDENMRIKFPFGLT